MLMSRRSSLWCLASCVSIVCLAGCGRPEQPVPATSAPAGRLQAVDRQGAVDVGGTERTYWMHLPASYDSSRPVPLVLVFHGGGGSGKRIARITGFSNLSDDEGFIVVYPDALDGHWNDGRSGAAASQADDVRFVSKLIDQLSVLLAIDRKRVYAAGISNGAIFVQRLGCELSDRITAIAAVAGPLATGMADKCTPTQPVAVLMIHGTADDFVPYAGGRVRGPVGGQVLSVQDTIERWLTANGCSDRSPTVTTLDPDRPDGMRVRRAAYSVCSQGTSVVLYTIEGGGHTWPGGMIPRRFGRVVGPTSRAFDATRTIWEFFNLHARP